MDKIKEYGHVFRELDAAGIEYCVLRNYDFLLKNCGPKEKSEQSVDIVVAKKHFFLFHTVMLQLGFIKRTQSFSLSHEPYFKIRGTEKISFDVQVGGIHWNDMKYLEDKTIMTKRVKKGSFYTLSDEDTFVMLVLHSILGKRYFKNEYQQILQNLSTKIDREYVYNSIVHNLGKKIGREVTKRAFKHDFKGIVSRKHLVVSSFILCMPKRVSTFTLLFFRWLKWKKFVTPYPLISFIGPDGSGKSTMAKELEEFLRSKGKKAKIVYTGRGRNQILPFRKIGKIYKSRERKKDRSKKIAMTSKKSWKRRVFYTLAAPVFTFDLLLRYFFRVLPKRFGKNIVITDRYSTDILLMENVPFGFREFLLYLFPKPSLTFYMHNTAEVLHARRPEEPIDGLERQMFYFQKLEGRLKPVKILTTSLEKNKEEVFSAVWTYLLQGWY